MSRPYPYKITGDEPDEELEGDLSTLTTREEDPRILSARHLVGTYQKAARSTRLYPAHSTILQKMLEDFAEVLAGHVAAYGETALSMTESTIEWGDDVLYNESDRSKSLAFKLYVNGIRLIVMRPGVLRHEADGVVEVLTAALRRDATTDALRTTIWERSFDHVDFIISDELFSAGEDQQFREFESNGIASGTGALTACAEMQPIYERLDALKPVDKQRIYHFGMMDKRELGEEVEREADRELFDGLADFLVAEFDGPKGGGVQRQIEGFLEHLVATGDIIRAARVLGLLRASTLRRPDDERRKAVQHALAKLAKTRVIPQLRPVLPSLDDANRKLLFRLVVALGEPAIAPLCDLMDSEYREEAQDALAPLGMEYPKSLLQFVQHPKGIVVRTCLELIGRAGETDLVSGIMPALRHPDVGVRREALRALKQLGGKRAVDLFVKALDDPGYEVRSLAIAALGEFGGGQASLALLKRIDDRGFLGRSEFEKRETFRALGMIGHPQIVAKLTEVLGTKSLLRRAKQDEIRALAASALGMIRTAEARRALMKHAKDGSDHVRRAVAGALHNLDKPQD